MEIERKFLAKWIPKDNIKFGSYIEQGYLSIDPEVRIREAGHEYFLTVKSDGDMCRQEYETQISRSAYNELYLKIKGNLLRKRRYLVDLYDGLVAEIDVYENFPLLQIVEVEFPNEETANNFIVPEWFGKEVTNDKCYKNKNLSMGLVTQNNYYEKVEEKI